MKARVVLRESTEALKEGYGFATQREDCLSFTCKRGLDIVKEHQLVESSSTWNRDKFDAIVAEAISERSEIPAIVFPRADRFARNIEAAGYYLGLLRRNGLLVMFAQQDLVVDNEASTMTVLTFYFHSFKAAEDGKTMRHNLLEGRNKLAERAQQVPNGSVPFPFDYMPKKMYGQVSTGKPIKNQERAGLVSKWCDWLLYHNMGINAIEKRLDSLAIRTRNGKKITAKMVKDILSNKALVGEFYWKGKPYLEDESLRIVSDEVFEAVQKRLVENEANSCYNAKKYDYPPFPHRCVIHHCGHTMERVPCHGAPPLSNKVERWHRVYYKCSKCKGKGSYIPAWDVWNEIQPELKAGILDEHRLIPALKAQLEDETAITSLDGEIISKNKAIRNLEDRKDTAVRMGLTLKNYPMEKVQAEIDRAEGQIQRLKAEKADLERQLSDLRERRVNLEGIRRFCQVVAKRVDNLSNEEWEALLKMLKLQITIHTKDYMTVKVALPSVKDTEFQFTQSKSSSSW